mmetsp:Transcript_43726/g.123880  ORF Transcript_43726/g.123880 Transcript_43726/m.123880 type:complete len:281 (-) Transcript_43726:803-1645(-)
MPLLHLSVAAAWAGGGPSRNRIGRRGRGCRRPRRRRMSCHSVATKERQTHPLARVAAGGTSSSRCCCSCCWWWGGGGWRPCRWGRRLRLRGLCVGLGHGAVVVHFPWADRRPQVAHRPTHMPGDVFLTGAAGAGTHGVLLRTEAAACVCLCRCGGVGVGVSRIGVVGLAGSLDGDDASLPGRSLKGRPHPLAERHAVDRRRVDVFEGTGRVLGGDTRGLLLVIGDGLLFGGGVGGVGLLPPANHGRGLVFRDGVGVDQKGRHDHEVAHGQRIHWVFGVDL